MSFYVLQAYALCGGHRCECTDLIHDQILDLTRRCAHIASPESDEVLKTGMSAYCHPVLTRESDCLPHHSWIAGMEPTGDIGGRNGRHQSRILAEFIGPERFAHIGVKV
jgi:hypothetical protein